MNVGNFSTSDGSAKIDVTSDAASLLLNLSFEGLKHLESEAGGSSEVATSIDALKLAYNGKLTISYENAAGHIEMVVVKSFADVIQAYASYAGGIHIYTTETGPYFQQYQASVRLDLGIGGDLHLTQFSKVTVQFDGFTNANAVTLDAAHTTATNGTISIKTLVRGNYTDKVLVLKTTAFQSGQNTDFDCKTSGFIVVPPAKLDRFQLTSMANSSNTWDLEDWDNYACQCAKPVFQVEGLTVIYADWVGIPIGTTWYKGNIVPNADGFIFLLTNQQIPQ